MKTKKLINKAMEMKKHVLALTEKLKWQYLMMMYGMFAPVNVAHGTTAEEKWDAVIGFIVPWVTRLGGVVVFIGAVEFGLAFKNDDAEGKTKGMRTVIAGLIVMGVGASSSIFLA